MWLVESRKQEPSDAIISFPGDAVRRLYSSIEWKDCQVIACTVLWRFHWEFHHHDGFLRYTYTYSALYQNLMPTTRPTDCRLPSRSLLKCSEECRQAGMTLPSRPLSVSALNSVTLMTKKSLERPPLLLAAVLLPLPGTFSYTYTYTYCVNG